MPGKIPACLDLPYIISPWVFPDEYGEQTRQSAAYKEWERYRKHHGITSSPYEMRHTSASVNSIEMPDKLLKLVMGHSAQMDTQGVYVHRVDGDIERARDIMNRVYSKILDE